MLHAVSLVGRMLSRSSGNAETNQSDRPIVRPSLSCDQFSERTPVPSTTMDLVLNAADEYVLTPYVYPSTWPEDDLLRQGLSLYAITILGGYFLYLSMACFSYVFIYDKNLMRHPQYLPGQVSLEIKCTCLSIPLMSLFTVPLFLLEVSLFNYWK